MKVIELQVDERMKDKYKEEKLIDFYKNLNLDHFSNLKRLLARVFLCLARLTFAKNFFLK